MEKAELHPRNRHQEAWRWFRALVLKSANLPSVPQALRWAEATDIRAIEMAQGQQTSRIVAWTFNQETTQVEHHG